MFYITLIFYKGEVLMKSYFPNAMEAYIQYLSSFMEVIMLSHTGHVSAKKKRS